jgi:pyridoxine 4-dehydrogenase
MLKTFTLPGTNLTLNSIGYGAMRLTGPHIWGPPKDVPGALEVLQNAIKLGVNHIYTSDFYGPHITNQLIRKALHPYAKDLTIVTKVGFRREPDSSWKPAHSAAGLEKAVDENLSNLGLDQLAIVNLRMPDGGQTSLREPLEALVKLQN